jgi:hypothetical protein
MYTRDEVINELYQIAYYQPLDLEDHFNLITVEDYMIVDGETAMLLHGLLPAIASPKIELNKKEVSSIIPKGGFKTFIKILYTEYDKYDRAINDHRLFARIKLIDEQNTESDTGDFKIKCATYHELIQSYTQLGRPELYPFYGDETKTKQHISSLEKAVILETIAVLVFTGFKHHELFSVVSELLRTLFPAIDGALLSTYADEALSGQTNIRYENGEIIRNVYETIGIDSDGVEFYRGRTNWLSLITGGCATQPLIDYACDIEDDDPSNIAVITLNELDSDDWLDYTGDYQMLDVRDEFVGCPKTMLTTYTFQLQKLEATV